MLAVRGAAVVTVLRFVILVVLLIALAFVRRAMAFPAGIVIARAHRGWSVSVNVTRSLVLMSSAGTFVVMRMWLR